tara:strand:+ start:554 stop:1624 length:1071 start_codon:yes stop_codon:yes gene_type:complete
MNNKNHTEISLDGIQNQINYCDEIIELVDKIVPKLYKVRQQSLAQKDYINDISRKLLTTGMDSTTGFEAGNVAKKKIVFADDSLGTTLVGNTWKDVSFKLSAATQPNRFNNTKEQRQVIQSLFKYKHEIGTENHFTTDQIGVAADRTHGLNLTDVKSLLTGINGLMKQSNSAPTAASADLKKILLKNIEKLDTASPPARVETLSVIPQDDGDKTVSKIIVSEKAASYQTKLSAATEGEVTIKYEDQIITPTEGRNVQTIGQSGLTVQADAVSAADYKARDAQYLAVADNKCEPASLFETIPNYSELGGKTSTFASAANIKTLAASDLVVTDTIKLGVELADPWDNRHKYVGFGLGD